MSSTSPRRVRNNVVGGLTPGLRNKDGARHGRRGSHKEGRSKTRAGGRSGGSEAPRSISLSPQRK